VDLLERTRDILRFRMRMAERLRSMTARPGCRPWSSRCSLRRSRSPFRRSTPISSRISSALLRGKRSWRSRSYSRSLGGSPYERSCRCGHEGKGLSHHRRTDAPGRRLSCRVPSAHVEGAFHRACPSSVPVLHDRLTEGLVSKRLLRFPGPASSPPSGLGVRGALHASRLPRRRFVQLLRVGAGAGDGPRRAGRLPRRVGLLSRCRAGNAALGAARSPAGVLPLLPPDRIGNERLFGASGNVGLDPGRSARAGTGGTGPVTIARRSPGESIERSRRRVPSRVPAVPQPCPTGERLGSGCHGACGNSPRRCWKPRAPCGDNRPACGVKMLFPWSFSSFPPCFSLSCPR